MIPYEVIMESGDTHIYLNHIEQIKEQLNREPYNLPIIKLNKEIKNIFDFKYEDIEILNYKSHPPIKLPIAV
jgi:thymidylate synthase